MRITTRRAIIASALALALTVSGCAGSRAAKEKATNNAGGGGATGSATGSGGAQADSGGGMIPELIFPSDVDAAAAGLENYNPNAAKPTTATFLFETLMIQNGLTCEVTPWLATKFEWEGATKLTFDIRDGVKWSDGQPFTAADAAFTFNLGKQYPAIDKGGIWNDTFGAKAKSVTAKGNQVVFEFTGNAAPKFQGILTTKILAEHIYSKVGDPTKYVDKDPVGTGPFTVGSYNGRRLELVRRDDYWQADKIKIQKLVLEGTYDAPSAALKLGAGELDAYFGEIPNPEKSFVAKDPNLNHYYYAPNGITVLSPNDTVAPFDDPKFREGISYAMDKDSMSLKATYNIMKPASQSGLKLPLMTKMLPPEYPEASTMLPFDVAKANQLLDAAGYPKGADGFRTNKDGSPLAINFDVQAGFIDYQAMADVVVQGLKAAGLNAKATQSAPDSVDQKKKSGDFQMLFEYLHGGCDFARGLGSKLTSLQIPTKTEILPNVERFKDAATDKTVADLGGTTDPAKQKEYVGQLVNTMMTQFPVTSLIYAPARIIYRTDHAVGWPSEQDPYAHPTDDRLIILTHLHAP